MDNAYIRDGATHTYIWNTPVTFQRLPCVNEFIWFNNQGYLVLAVIHTWDDSSQPMAVLDIALSTLQQSSPL